MKRFGAAIVWGLALAFIAIAPLRALAQPAAYTANCTGGGCHTTPTNPYVAQLNGANAANVFLYAISPGGMTSVSLTGPEQTAIATYINGFLTTPPVQAVAFNAGGGTTTTFALSEITVGSPFGALTGLASTAATNGSVTFLTGPARAQFTPTACVVGASVASFNYHGTGPGGPSSTRTQTVTISNPTTPPSISSAAPPAGQTGVAYSFNANVAQCNGLVTWSHTGTLPPGVTLNAASGLLSGTPTTLGTFNGNLVATWPGGQNDTQAFSINITLGPPSITSSATASNTAEGVFVANAYTIVATNSPTSYSLFSGSLPPGLSVAAGTGVVSGTPTSAAGSPYVANLRATNATGSDTQAVTFNVAPAINSANTANGQTGVAFTYTLTKTAGPAFTTYSNLDPLPAGLSLTAATGVVSGTPTTIQTVPVRFTGTTGAGATSAQYTVTFTIGLGPPVITSSLVASGGDSVVFTPYQITATNTPHTGYNATGLPAGLNINTGTGVISGTPAIGSGGVYPVTISATNATGTGSAILVITISQFAPVITSSLSPPAAFTGVPYSYQITASNGPTTFNATSLPAGLSVNTGTGLISGTPTAVGASVGTIGAANGAGFDNKAINWNVLLGPPVITSPNTAGGAVGFAFSYQITATNPPFTSFNAVGLPPGVTVDTTTGLISGTPTLNGVYNATISATNSNSTANQALTITIAVGIPVITSAGAAAGAAGTAFNYQIVATNGPTSYGATGLPSGLTINPANGQISGIPIVDGVFAVNLSATNGTGTGTKALTLTIALTPPIIISPSAVTTKPGDNFHYELKALVGSPTYTATGLPTGLTLDPVSGFITGMMTAGGGTFTVNIVATNAAGSTNFVLKITVGFTIATAGDTTVEVPFETPTGIALKVSGDVTTVNIVSLPSHGLVTTQGSSTTVTYSPASGYFGPDTFTYAVTNPAGTSSVATVKINVLTAVPTAGAGSVIVQVNTSTPIDMAKFAKGSGLTGVAITTPPAHGTASTNGLSIVYTPRTNYFGPDSFTYVAIGNAGTSAPATVKIEIIGRPDPTLDRDVLGVIDAQSQAARRFAGAQIGNYQRRMDSLHRPAPAAETPPPAANAAKPPPRARAPEPVQLAFADSPTHSDAPPVPLGLVNTLMTLATTGTLDLSVSAPSDSGGGGPRFAGETSWWVAGTAIFGNRDATSSRSSMRFGTDGISAGADRRISERMALGFGAGYARDDTDAGTSSRVKSTAGSIATYGSYQAGPRTFIDVLLGYGQLKFDSRRFVEPLDGYATANRKGSQVFGSVAASYEHRDRNLLVSPYGRIDFAFDRLDKVSESGVGGFALTYDDATQRSVQAAVGVRVESKHETNFGFAVPRARAEYRRELQSERSVTLSYADLLNGPLYTVTPMGVSRNSLLLGVGTDFVFRGGLRFGIDYTAQRASGSSNVQGVRMLLTQDLDALAPAGWRWEPTTFKLPVNVDAGYAWDDNVSRGREAGEKLVDSSFSFGANVTRPFTINANTRFVVTGLASAEKFDRYQGLGRFSGGAQGELQYRSSGAFDAITFGFVGRALYERYESSLRTGPRYFAGVNARRSITDRIDLFAEVGANARNGRSDVFNWRDWSAKANLDWSLGRNGLVYATGEYRRGDTVSSGHASLVNLSLAEVFVADDAFESQDLFAYKFDAKTLIGTLGYNVPLGARDSLDFSWRRVESTPTKRPSFDFSGQLKYIDNQYTIVYLIRF